MLEDLGLMVAAVYFSSLLFVLIPGLGLVAGAVTGKLTPNASIALGSLIGLACGAVGLALSLLAYWALSALFTPPWPDYSFWLLGVILPLGGALSSVGVLQLFRRRQGRTNGP